MRVEDVADPLVQQVRSVDKLNNHRQSRWVQTLTREPLKAVWDWRRSRAALGAA
ncbi:MAG: hypothetical protein FWD69_20005 [Polyangiaceae bacterium]|nr:hypothetical protein [Polyangiaceae bacterium]